MEKYIECGDCGHFHRESFWGDCRVDSERFTLDEIPQNAEYLTIGDLEIMEKEE